MTEEVQAALFDAVRIAKDQGIRHVASLRIKLRQAGHSENDVQSALQYWADYEKGRR